MSNPFDDNFGNQQQPQQASAETPQGNGGQPQFSMEAIPTQMQNGNLPPQGQQMGQPQQQVQNGGYAQPTQQQYQQPQQQSQQGGYQQSQGGGYGGQQRKKYRIHDFFWFINPKLLLGQNLEGNEAAVLSVGYNCDFDNLRLTFYGNAQGALTPGAVVLEHLQPNKLAIGHLYPEARQELLYLTNQEAGEGTIHCFERTIKQSQYTPNPTQMIVTPDTIQIQSTNSQSNQTGMFTLTGWQREAFIKATKTVTNVDHWSEQIRKI
jgi:hypothetical protein